MTLAAFRTAANAVAGSILAASAATGLCVHRHPGPPPLRRPGVGLDMHLSTATPDPDGEPTPARRLQGRFRPGDHYVWLYRDKHGAPTSWERYEVVSASPEGEEVTIEMATKFAAGDGYSVHHRMRVNLANHLAAAEDRGDWRIGFEHCVGGDGDGADPSEGGWRPFGTGDNVQAFEEKFDIFSMLNMTNKYEGATCVADIDDRSLTLTRSGRHDYTGAWYAPSTHDLSGIALAKDFNEHSFSLIRTKRDGREADVRVNRVKL